MNLFKLVSDVPMPQRTRLRLRQYLLDRLIDKEQRRARENGVSEAAIWADGQMHFEYQLLQDDQARFHSRQLLRQARSLRIPLPDVFKDGEFSEDYQSSGLEAHRYYLSPIGEQKIRAAVREEEKYRSERRARRIPYITALTGLIGTITGLVVALAKIRT